MSPASDATDDPGAGPAPGGRSERARRALRLGWRHRGDVARALVLLPVVAASLRRRGYRATDRWLDRRRPVPDPSAPETAPVDPVGTARGVAFAVRAAARPVPDASCLRTSLVLRHLLRRHGIPSAVRLGVRPDPDGGEYAFHAWVDVDGEVVSEPAWSVADFVVLSGEDPRLR